MPFPAAYLLIAGGVCAGAPLFKKISNSLSRFLSGIGFFVGIGIVIIAADIALNLNLLTSFSSPPAKLSNHQYLQFWLPLMLVLGVLLFSRPIRNLRWASLVALAGGLLATYYLHVLFLSSTTPDLTLILGVVFIVVTVAVYALLRFVEDLVEFIGTIFAFPPIAVGVGFVSIYFGVLIATSYP